MEAYAIKYPSLIASVDNVLKVYKLHAARSKSSKNVIGLLV